MIQMPSKLEIRQKSLDKRLELTYSQKLILSKKINQKLFAESAFVKSKNIGTFMSTRNEPMIFFHPRKKYAAPKIIKNKIKFCRISNCFKKGKFNILEPNKADPINLSQLNIIILPLVAFNLSLYRIGYGKGYFDKLFQNINRSRYRPRLWGVGYDFQLQDYPFQNKTDIRLDKIITDQNIYE